MYTRLNKKFKEIQKVKKQGRKEPFEISPIEGYKEHINEVTRERLPYCCDTHLHLYENLVEIYAEPHLTHLPEKFLYQLAYTEYFIENRINKEDWYKDITDYIIYNYASFGQPGYGVLDFLKLIIQYLEKTEVDIAIEKRKELIEFIESYAYKEKWPDFGAQLEMLHSTYKRWLKLFPFDLMIYFKDIGKYFNTTLPFFYITDRDFNPYLNTYIPQIHTKDSLMKYLTDLTDDILSYINGAMLHEKGYIGNADLFKLELAINSRKQKSKIGYNNSLVEDESRINQMIEEWFEDEKNFFNEITPLLSKSQPEKTLHELPENSCWLEQLFEDVSKYKKVMEILVEQNHIQANTYVWKDDGKGNKGYLAALIKYLYFQGYYKKKYKPNPKQIQQIISNTFKRMTAIDTIKKAKSDDFNFAFIPPASTLS